MSVRLITRTSNVDAHSKSPEWIDTTTTQRETTKDGYTFHWGPNEVRNFMDDGVGVAHGAFSAVKGANVQENTIPFNDSRS